jgi:hypothetical protein
VYKHLLLWDGEQPDLKAFTFTQCWLNFLESIVDVDHNLYDSTIIDSLREYNAYLSDLDVNKKIYLRFKSKSSYTEFMMRFG